MGLTVVDAGVLIGFLDGNDVHHAAAFDALSDAVERNDRLVLPASALAEVLVGPHRRGRDAVAAVKEMIARLPIDVAPLDALIAEAAAALRATHSRLKLPDALVLATTSVLDADRLVTTDRGWPTRRTLKLRAAMTVL